MDSMAIGNLVQPLMMRLTERVALLDAALLCTSDGFNVCSVGFSEDQIGKLSALASSMLSLGEATITSLTVNNADNTMEIQKQHLLDTLILEAGDTCLVGVKLKTINPLHFIAIAKKTAMGVLLVSVRRTAQEIEAHLPCRPIEKPSSQLS